MIFMSIQKKQPIIPDVEYDIEGQPITSIERRGDETIFVIGLNYKRLCCNVSQHNAFVKRFRLKLNIPNPQ